MSAQTSPDPVAEWRTRQQAEYRQRCHWRTDPSLTVAEGARGTGWRRGEPGLGDFPAGTYPACSLHGAMIAVGGGYWRCLVEGCNAGAKLAAICEKPCAKNP